jgi:hypothetical protein
MYRKVLETLVKIKASGLNSFALLIDPDKFRDP